LVDELKISAFQTFRMLPGMHEEFV
jgi:hypothetical protein